jgi:hypothetical protein
MRLRSSQALSEYSRPCVLTSKHPVLSVRQLPRGLSVALWFSVKNAVNDAFAG